VKKSLELARWLGERTGGEPFSFERVEPGDEQVLPDRDEREPMNGTLTVQGWAGAPAWRYGLHEAGRLTKPPRFLVPAGAA